MTADEFARRFRIAPPPPPTAAETAFAREMHAPRWVAQLLSKRDVTTLDGARAYLRPTQAAVCDSASLEGLSEIVETLVGIRERGEALAIHGDYDVDGLTGAALLRTALRECGFRDIEVFIPSRFGEGYGVNRATVDALAEKGTRWLLTVDTGVSAVEEVAYANERGVRVMVTDHHKQGPVLPAALAIANPNCNDSRYPNKNLSGVGVAFKLVDLLVRRLGLRVDASAYLDYVALGTLADVVSLVGENRYFVREGLKKLAATRRPGLRALVRESGARSSGLRSQDVLFRMTPLVNSAGRMGNPRAAYELLVTEDEREASRLLNALVKANVLRRRIENETTERAQRWLREHPEELERPVVMVTGEDWPEEVVGVVGIVAARLVDRIGKPVAVAFAEPRTGLLRASARGVEGFDWHAALLGAEDLLDRWGGHSQAAGFSLRPEAVPAFRERVCACAEASLPARAGADRRLTPDCEVDFDQVDSDTLAWLARFEPFGHDNEPPVFFADGVSLAGECRVVGQSHLKLKLKQNGHTFDAIAFGQGELRDALAGAAKPFAIAYSPELNRFRDKETLQLQVVAISAMPEKQE